MPERTSRAAGCDVIVAIKDSRDRVVGSSAKTSSRRVVFWMASSMEGVGVVVTSPREGQSLAKGVQRGEADDVCSLRQQRAKE